MKFLFFTKPKSVYTLRCFISTANIQLFCEINTCLFVFSSFLLTFAEQMQSYLHCVDDLQPDFLNSLNLVQSNRHTGLRPLTLLLASCCLERRGGQFVPTLWRAHFYDPLSFTVAFTVAFTE